MSSGWWVADLLHSNPMMLVSWVVWVIGSIVLHELAHGWAAIHEGDRTPIEMGHMTWNPLVHMGGFSLAMFALVGIAWGMMPVNPSRFRSRYADARVALAGPAMNVGLALVAMVLGGVWAGYFQWVSEPVWGNVLTFLQAGAFLNIVLAAFNLLPVPPLDGSRILAEFWPAYRRLLQDPRAVGVALLVFVLVFFKAGDVIFGPAREVSWWGIEGVRSVLPGAKATARRASEDMSLNQLIDAVGEPAFAKATGLSIEEVGRLRRGELSPEELKRVMEKLGSRAPGEEAD